MKTQTILLMLAAAGAGYLIFKPKPVIDNAQPPVGPPESNTNIQVTNHPDQAHFANNAFGNTFQVNSGISGTSL